MRIGDREVPLRPRGFGVNRFYFCPAKRPRSSLAPTVHIRQQFPTRTPPLSPLSTQIPSIGIVISSTSGETPGGCYEEPSGLIPALQESLLHSSILKILWKSADNTITFYRRRFTIYGVCSYGVCQWFEAIMQLKKWWSVCILTINWRRKCTKLILMRVAQVKTNRERSRKIVTGERRRKEKEQ